MISFDEAEPALVRFVRELREQGPPVDGRRPDLAKVTRDDVRVARLAWAERIVDEYRSVVVFSELLRLLAETEAPFAVLCAVQRIVGDELRHVELCRTVVGWLGDADALTIDLAGLGVPASSDPPRVRALEIVARELVVAETASIRALRTYLQVTEDAAIRAVLRVLLQDEVRHAAAGRAIEVVLRRTFADDPAVRALLESLPRWLAREREYLEARYVESAVGGPGRALGASISLDDWLSLAD